FILMFLPDPVSVLRSVVEKVRPGGVIAFQEPSWTPLLALAARFPLWSGLVGAIHETLLRAGANTEMGPALHSVFQEVGLPAPQMHMEMLLGSEETFRGLHCEALRSLRPLAERLGVPLEPLGDLDTLSSRVSAEVAESRAAVGHLPLVGAWA